MDNPGERNGMGWGERSRAASESSLDFTFGRLLKEVPAVCGRSPEGVAPEGFPQWGGDHGEGPSIPLGTWATWGTVFGALSRQQCGGLGSVGAPPDPSSEVLGAKIGCGSVPEGQPVCWALSSELAQPSLRSPMCGHCAQGIGGSLRAAVSPHRVGRS